MLKEPVITSQARNMQKKTWHHFEISRPKCRRNLIRIVHRSKYDEWHLSKLECTLIALVSRHTRSQDNNGIVICLPRHIENTMNLDKSDIDAGIPSWKEACLFFVFTLPGLPTSATIGLRHPAQRRGDVHTTSSPRRFSASGTSNLTTHSQTIQGRKVEWKRRSQRIRKTYHCSAGNNFNITVARPLGVLGDFDAKFDALDSSPLPSAIDTNGGAFGKKIRSRRWLQIWPCTWDSACMLHFQP